MSRTLDFSDGFSSSTEPTSGAEAADIVVTPAGNLASTDVQAALEELQSDVDSRASSSDLTSHINDTTAAHAASAVSFSPTGTIAATDAQSAIAEVATDASAALSSHTGNTSNPHSVTAAQVGNTTAQWNANKLQSVDVSSTAPSTDQFLKYNGSAWIPSSVTVSLSVASKTATYSVTTSDDVLLGNASGGAFTFNLPTAVGNTGKQLRFIKTDSSFNAITLDGNSTETIGGSTTTTLNTEQEALIIVSDGTNWQILERRIPGTRTSYTPTFGAGFGTASSINFWWWREGNLLKVYGWFTAGTVAGSASTISIPSGLTFDNTQATANARFGSANQDSGTNSNLIVQYSTTTAVRLMNNSGQVLGNQITANNTGVYVEFSGKISGWNG